MKRNEDHTFLFSIVYSFVRRVLVANECCFLSPHSVAAIHLRGIWMSWRAICSIITNEHRHRNPCSGIRAVLDLQSWREERFAKIAFRLISVNRLHILRINVRTRDVEVTNANSPVISNNVSYFVRTRRPRAMLWNSQVSVCIPKPSWKFVIRKFRNHAISAGYYLSNQLGGLFTFLEPSETLLGEGDPKVICCQLLRPLAWKCDKSRSQIAADDSHLSRLWADISVPRQ